MSERKFDLPDGEEFALKEGPSWGDAHRVRVGPKVLTWFVSKDGNDYVSFQKRRWNNEELLEVTVRQRNKIRHVQTCNLGHEHVEERDTLFLWERFAVPWEHVEQLIGWLEKGSWTQVQRRKLEAQE